MAGFSVSPQELRVTASKLDSVVDAVTSSDSLATSADFGHEALSQAASEFTSSLDGSWEARARATSGVAAGLRRAADVYEEADNEGASLTRSGGERSDG